MAAKGVDVKILKERPELFETELFYMEMYQVCGADFSNIKTFCQLHRFDNQQILESVKIVSIIASGVDNASNTA